MGKFVIRQTATGFKFDLKAGNGETIAASEIYATRAACIKGIESVRACCMGEVEDRTEENVISVKHPKYELYTDRAGEYRFRLKAKNGGIIAAGEGYKSKAGCLSGIDSIRKNAPEAGIEE